MAGGVVIGGTRVVYLSDKKEVSVSVNNLEKESVYLIQSWIQDENEKTKTPFIVTPPLFKLPANNENILRIIKVSDGLPMDRESIFWLNVTSIPETVKSNADVNQLQIVVNSRLKLFYRPTQLEENSGEAYKRIKFRKENGVLIAENSTPYFISFSHLKVDGKEVEGAGMVNPFSQANWPLPVKNAKSVSWKAINDYGGVTQEEFAGL
ncbi:putative periplasmic chaperone protein with PapD-like and periplasmic chaperone C-domains [Xenorhabdus bovienii SS-2004]|uniref:Putative periplasmic chaperone protein with PapD-like and periplasmic chaperone C-domains n=2 Tax=Xenorhabdus bovienii TaxID=40576 RepID=D3UWP9_XENBS|nr:putative periplasmic chaperone protein with PapD-like and periplasmic chaperone C-domains [Xenorhabdus bovienii SS-2004]